MAGSGKSSTRKGSLNDRLAELERLVAAAETQRAQAEAVARELSDDVAEGRPLDPEALTKLKGYNEALQVALAGLDGGGQEIERPDSIGSLRDALDQKVERERSREETAVRLHGVLARLAELPVGDGPDLLAGCRRRAAELQDADLLEDEEKRQVAEGLAALVDLNEASTAAEKKALSARATELLPLDCQPAVGIAAFGNLELIDEKESPTVDEPSPVPEEPPDVAQPPEDRGAEKSIDTEASSDEEVEAALEQLLRERRFGLAHWIVRARSPERDGLAAALKGLAYADSMRSAAGESASRVRELAEEFPFEGLRGDKAATLLTLVAGLRGTLVAPYSGAADLLGSVASHYVKRPSLQMLIDAVSTAGQRGLSAPDMTEQVQTIVTAEDNLRAVQERAAEMLRLRTIKYARATHVWQKWIEPDGLLGALLNAVVEDRSSELAEIEQSMFALRGGKVLERKLDETDRQLKAANRQRQIVADARQKLVERAEESLAIVAEWIEASRNLDRVRQRQANEKWQKDLLENLRSAALEARNDVTGAWQEWGAEEDLRGAVAVGTLPAIKELFALVIDGQPLKGSEEHVDEVLGLDLLKVSGLALDSRLEPIESLRLGPLLAAVDSDDWEVAFERRVEEGNFEIAARIVEVLRRRQADLGTALERRRLELLRERRDHFDRRIDEAERALGAARREGRVSDAEGFVLASRLSAMEPKEEQQDLRDLDTALDDFSAGLKEAEAEGIRQAREAYLPRLAEDPQLKPHRDRLQRLLDKGEIATLEELVLAIEREAELPEGEDRLFRQLTEFFPAVSDDKQVAQAGPQAQALASAVAERQSFGSLDFSSLKEEEVKPVQAAIDAWHRLDCGDFGEAEDDFEHVLDMLGLTIEHGVDQGVWRGRNSEKRRKSSFVATPLGKALVPAFGSGAQDGRYRVLMLHERMSDDAIAALIGQEDGEQPLLVLCFGAALPETARRGVADHLRHQPSRRPVVLIDGPAFLYIASKGGRNLATTIRVALPFSAVNPYTPFAPGSVPLEMFYGRERELVDVLDRTGTSFIYGGRRLGKSALLRAAQRKFEVESSDNRAVYVDLKTSGIGERQPADKIVDEIAKALLDADVMTFGGAKEAGYDEVSAQVRSWLSAESRRILLLLDECDSFLNEDAKENFPNVTWLKSLMEATDRRFKPVFAGLHQVRRFQRIPNQPLAHFGHPTPVGPLKPQPAYDLIVKPLEALGMRFESPDLPTRILTTTNYQPSLIQLFCSELVDHILGKACGPGTPPYPVTSHDVEAVHNTPRVGEEMRTRFELTTNLDPRYRVIANSVAFEALEGDLAVGLSASEIRAMCDEYWPQGFAKTTSDEFRALLEEMNSLGVLFEDGEGRFLMRSPNVLRMLGTAEQIEGHLKASDELELPQGFEAASFRDSLGKDHYRRQPFTHEQAAALLAGDEEGFDSLLRVVVGTPATGLADTMACLQQLFEDGSGRYNFTDATSLDQKRLLNRFNRSAKKKRRVVACTLKPGSPGEVLALIRAVGEKISRPETRSTVVFVVPPGALRIWEALVVPEGSVGADQGGAAERLELIELKRWSKAGLRAWAQAQNVELPFSEDGSLNTLMQGTGGWPVLVDRVVGAYLERHDWRRAILDLEKWLASSAGAASLCTSIGLTAECHLVPAWNMLTEYGDPIPREEVQALADDDGIANADRAAETLRSMQLLHLDADGRYVVEPTAASAWKRLGSAAPDAAS